MPAPPYSGGKTIPSNPSLPSSLMVARGNSPASSHFMTLGLDLALGKLANAFLQVQLLFVQLEIQGSSSTLGPQFERSRIKGHSRAPNFD